MPDVVRLRYTGAGPVAVPALGREVEPDHLVEFGGRVIEEQADCWLIESGKPTQIRAWPKSLWGNETVATVKKSRG